MRRSGAADRARFFTFVDRSDSAGCWPWRGSLSASGYGRFWAAGRAHRAHRYAYQVLVGPVRFGLELDHLCARRDCVNPAHLEPVIHRENCRRAREAGVQLRLLPA